MSKKIIKKTVYSFSEDSYSRDRPSYYKHPEDDYPEPPRRKKKFLKRALIGAGGALAGAGLIAGGVAAGRMSERNRMAAKLKAKRKSRQGANKTQLGTPAQVPIN